MIDEQIPDGILISVLLAKEEMTEDNWELTTRILGEVPKVSFQKATAGFFSVLCFDWKPAIKSGSISERSTLGGLVRTL